MSNKKNTFFSWFKKIKNKSLSLKKTFFQKDISKNKSNLECLPENQSISFLNRIFISIKNKKDSFAYKIKKFFKKQEIDDNFFDKLEEMLLMFDFGVYITRKIINILLVQYKKKEIANQKDLYIELKKILFNIIYIHNLNLYIPYTKLKKIPHIILVVGVNGVGKTTAISKLAFLYKQLGYAVMLSASDTFRAAAIDQLKIWGERIKIPVFYKSPGDDPSSVIFDSIQQAQKDNIEILIIDTSGRLHNKIYLMEELKKNIRVIEKKNFAPPQEILLVLDACNGQNSMNQTKVFVKELNSITGIILTKLDSTSKGGIIFSIVEKFRIPIKYISTGEHIKDFHVFHPEQFINTFLNQYEE